ncbi:hypothetical protein HZA96_01545 [Candidatus Woesearchaeota archaeon]|nr:hypothetical protein [Candidatus Woesearchaeota archaeon]
MSENHSTRSGSLLEQIVTALNPEHIIETVTKKHRQAKVEYHIQHAKPNYNEFLDEITKYMQHHWRATNNATLNESDARGHAIRYLESAFQKHGGFKGASSLATTKGEMDKVIDALSSQIESEARNNYVSGVMYSVDPTDNETKTEIIKEVFERYKAMVGENTTFKDPVYFAEKYDEIVQQYMQIVQHIVDQYGASTTNHDEHGTPIVGGTHQQSGGRIHLPNAEEIAAVSRGARPSQRSQGRSH